MHHALIRIARGLAPALIVGACVLAAARDASALTKYTVQSGPWESSTTWLLGLTPTATDDVVILSGHVVTTGNTSANITYTIRSLEVRANARIESGTNSFRTYIQTSANGPTGYAVLNNGQIHGQLNRTSVVECAGNLRTDGSGITNRTTQPMGGTSWGWNNWGHNGNAWPHNHVGNNGDSTPGICLILTGGAPTAPATIAQATAVNTVSPPASGGLDALPRTYIKGHYRLASSVEMNAFEQQLELGGALDLNGYQLLVRGPLHVGDPGYNSLSYTLASDGAVTALTTSNFVGGSIPGTAGSGWSNIQNLWVPGSSATVAYSTAPKKVASAFPSDWGNSQGASGTFNFYGQNVRDLWVSVNGWVGFMSTYTSSHPYCYIGNMLSTFYPTGFAIAGGYYCQLTGSYGHRVRAGLYTPSSGNREYVIEHMNKYYPTSTTSYGQFWHQIRLEENTNVIRFRYNSGQIGNTVVTWNTTSAYATIGIENPSGTGGVAAGAGAAGNGWAYQTEPTTHQKFTPQYPTQPRATLTIGDGTGTANQNSWPQFRITGGAACIWGAGARVVVPNGDNGSAMLGVGVKLDGDAKLLIHGQPTLPSSLQGWSNAGRAPGFWVIGYLALGGTSLVEVIGPNNAGGTDALGGSYASYTATNPYNSMLQVGQSLDFLTVPATGAPMQSQGHVTLTGHSGTYNTSNPTGPQPFPVLLVQGGVGGSSNFVTSSVWQGSPGGATPGVDTAGMTIRSSSFVHQGGLATIDGFQMDARADGSLAANPGSAWGVHSLYIGLAANGTIPLSNGTSLELGGPGTFWNLDHVALSVNGNRQAINGGGGNLFVGSGAFFGHRGVASNLPTDGSIGMVDCNGTLQVTGAAQYYQGDGAQLSGGAVVPLASPQAATLRVLGQGTLPPGSSSTAYPALDRGAPLGNVSVDDGGTLQSVHSGNVLVFIGEKWHSASVTIKLHPWKVSNARNGQATTFTASGGSGTYTFEVLSDSPGTGGSAGSPSVGTQVAGSSFTYTAGSSPAGATGTAVIRVTDGNGEFYDGVVTYGVAAQGPLFLSPGYPSPTTVSVGYSFYHRTGVSGFTPSTELNAYAGSGTYSWSVTGNGSLSATSGSTVTFSAGSGTALGTVVCSDGSASRTAYMYHSTSTSYGGYYPSPYYFYHLHTNTQQTLRMNPAQLSASPAPTWSFTSNPANGSFNSGTSTATGMSVTLNVGTQASMNPYSTWVNGTVVSTTSSGSTQTGYWYYYATAYPSDLAIAPLLIEGLTPGSTYQFAASGGVTPYSFSIAQSGGGASISSSGLYTAGASSTAPDVVDLTDGGGISRTATVKKGLPTPSTGNSYVAVPGAKTIFTNSSVNAVDQIIFADTNDDFGRMQVLKTLATGTQVMPSAFEITPILITMVSGTTQTFRVVNPPAGVTHTWRILPNNSGATPSGSVNGTSFTYTAGSTVNVTDTILCTDSRGSLARATVNVVSQAGSSPLELRPKYVYYLLPGQTLNMRTVGGKGTISWSVITNNSGGGLASTTGTSNTFQAGTAVTGIVWDTLQVNDSSGDWDRAMIGVYNWTSTSPYVFPAYAYYWWTSNPSGKTRNGLVSGQTLAITSLNGPPTSWGFSTNASGATLTSSGATAIYTAGSTTPATDYVQAKFSNGWLRYGYYAVQPPPMSVSPASASVFGATVVSFSAFGGGSNKTWSLQRNDSGASLSATSGSSISYTAGATGGLDVVRVADGVSWTTITISVLAASNPTHVRASHLDVWHGELNLNGQPVTVYYNGSNPAADGTVIYSNGGLASPATRPTLTSTAASGALNVGRTLVFSPFCDENVTAGTITIDGSLKVTEDTTQAVPFDLSSGSGTSRVIFTGNNPDLAVANQVEAWHATVTGSGTPTTACLKFADLQRGAGTSTTTLAWKSPLAWNNYTTVTPAPAETPSPPTNSCTGGSGLPPGFTLYSNPSTQPLSGAVPTGVWIRSGNSTTTSWQSQAAPYNGCWTISTPTTIQGGLVIENGCVDVQATLTVVGDVYVGIGNLTQDRNLNPTLRLTTGTPQLLVQEATPGSSADGNFFHNPGATSTITRGLLAVDTSCKIADDPGTTPATGRTVNLVGTAGQRVTLRLTGAGQEGGLASRVYRVNATGGAQALAVDVLHVNKAALANVVDLQGQVDVWQTLDVDRGTVASGNGWALHLRGATWDTERGGVVSYATGFTVWVDGDRSSAAPSGATAAGVAVPTVTVQETGTGTAPTLPTTFVDHPGAPTGTPPDLVRLGSNVTAQNWYVQDGTFTPGTFALTAVQDVSLGLGTLATDRANNPTLTMNGGAVLAGRDFLFFPGATEAVDAGVLEAQRDFSITDDPGTSPATNRLFDLQRDLAGTLNGTSLVRLTGATSPGRIFRQDPSATPQTLFVYDLTVQRSAAATVQLWSTIDVRNTFTLVSGTVAGTNGTLVLHGNWFTNGGAYTNFPAGITVSGTTAIQVFTGVAGSPVPAVQINKSAGVVQLGTATGNGTIFEVGGNFWIQDGTVDVNGNELRIDGDLFQGTPDGTGTIQASLTRTAEPTLQANDGTASATIQCRRVAAGVGGTWAFYPGSRERVEHATIRLERNGFFQDDTSAAAGATGRAFDLHRTSPATGSPAVHTTPTTLVLQGPDNATVWRSDDQTAGLVLDVRDLTVNKVPTAATVTFQTPIQIWGTYTQQSGTVASGTLYVNGNWTATGGSYGAGVTIVVQGTQNQTFTSAIVLPTVFINKTSGGWVRVATGQTLQTGTFTIQAGEVDLNGGTLEVNGNFAVGVNTTPNTNGQAIFLCSSNSSATATASGLGGTLNVKATNGTNGNCWIFNGVTAVIDTGIVYVDGDVYVDDAAFAFTDFADAAPGNVLELRNNRGTAVALWSAQPASAPLLTCFDLTLNKSGAAPGSQVNVSSPVRVVKTFTVRGTTVVHGALGTGSPLQVEGPVTTVGTSASFTAVTVVEVRGATTQTLGSTIPLPIVYIIKPNTTPALVNGSLQTLTFIIQQGTLDLNGGTLTVTGWMQVGTGASPAASPAPTFLQQSASGGGTLRVQAPTSAGASGTLYWLSDAQGTLDTGLIDLQGGLDVRSLTWAPAGAGSVHRVEFSGNRSSTVVAASTVQPTGYPAVTLVFQDLTVAKTGSAPGDRVDFTASDVAVQGTFTSTSGTVNTSPGSGAFLVKLFGAFTATGGSFTPASWVSFEGATPQTAAGAGGTLPNVQIQKSVGSLPQDEVVFSGTLTMQSLLVLDGSAVVTDPAPPASGSTAITVVTTTTVGSGTLATDQANAPEFRMSTSGLLSYTVGTNFGFWAGSVESIASGTLRITGSLQAQEDSAVGGNRFDLAVGSAPNTSTVEFVGNTPSTYYLVDQASAVRPLGFFHLTINKTTGVAATATSPVTVAGTLTVQSGVCATSGAGVLQLRGNWTHPGTTATYASGTTVVLDGTAAQSLPNAPTVALPSITIDKASGTATVPAGGTATVGSAGAGALFWVRQGAFDPAGGTLVVHGVFFVGDSGAATSRPTAPSVLSGSAASVVDVNATSQPPSGFSQDGDVVVGRNGTSNSPATAVNATTLTAGRWQVGHRLAIDDPNFATGANFLLQLDGNAGTQGPGEAFSVQPAGNPLLTVSQIEIVKSGGGQGATAKLLSPCVVSGHVTVTSGTFDLANQPRLDVGGNWTVAAAASVVPTITPVSFVGATSPVAITINSGAAPFFDVFVQKTTGTDTVMLSSAATPALPVVIERQLVVAQGTATVTSGHRVVVGAGSWVGNCVVGTGSGTATAVVSAGATLALGPAAVLTVDTSATLVQVGTGAAARARLTSVQPGVARWSGVMNGTWQAQWFEVSSPNGNGLQLGSTAKVTGAPQDLSDGLWDHPGGGGVLLDLGNTDGTTTKPAACYRNVFQNSGGASGAGNVAASGTTTAIRFLNATGGLAGEAFDVEPSGPGPLYWNVATLQVAVAASTPAATDVLATQSGIGLLGVTLRETSGTEGADVTSLTFAATSGSTTTGWSNLRCWLDADGSGTVTAGDTALGATASGFTSGTVSFSGTPLVPVAAGATVALLVTADTSSATAPSTLAVEVRAATDVVATGSNSGLAAQVPGALPASGNTMTVEPSGRITVALGPESPAAGNVLSTSSAASQNVVMGQWVLQADALEAHDLSVVTFTDVSTGTVSGITNVRLVLDNGSTPGVRDGSDTQLGAATTYNGSRIASFSGLPLTTIAAGGRVTVLLVQDFPTGLTAGTTYQAELTSLSATGRTSGASSRTAGTPSPSTVQTVAANGSATVRLGPNSPAATGLVKTTTGHIMGQWQVQVSAAEAMALARWVVTDGGTANASGAVTTVRLYLDVNGDGALQGTDPQVGGAVSFSGSTATIALSPSLALGAGSTTRFLVVYDCSGGGTAGQTLDARLQDGTALVLTGQSSSASVTATAQPGYPVSGGAWTLTDGPPVLAFTAGTGHPGARTVPANQSGVVVAVARIGATGENQTVTACAVTGSGTANEATAVSAVRLFDDRTGTVAGQLDAGDTALGTPRTFAVDNGTVTFAGLSLAVAQGTSADVFVVYDFNASGVTSGSTVRARVTACTASGDTSGTASQVTGLPWSGNDQTLAVPGTLSVSAGARMPAAQTVAPGTAAVPVWQARVQAGTAEDLLVTGLSVQPASGTPPGLFGTLRLFWDANGNGQLDSGTDVLIAAPGQMTGSPMALNWALAQRVSAGTHQDWLIVADVQGTMGQSGALEVPVGGVTVQGLSSGLTESTGVGVTGLPQSGGTVRAGAAGSVACYAGAQGSPARTEPAGTTGIPVAQFTLRASPVEAATLTRLVVTDGGTGTPATDVAAVRVWVDADGDGRVGATEAQLGATQTFTGTSATFTGLTQAVPAGGDVHLVVTYDLASVASGGAVFRSQLAANTDVAVTGQVSGAALSVAGAPVMGHALTVGTAPTLLVSAGAPWPGPAYLPPAVLPAGGVVVAPLRLEATAAAGVDLTALTLTARGTGDDRVLGVRVYADANGDGRLDGGDVLLGLGGYAADNGTWTLALSPAVTLAAGSAAQWLVAYDVPAGAGDGATFLTALVPAGDIAAVQSGSTTPAAVNGPALQSAPLLISPPPSFGAPTVVASGSSGGGCFVATACGDATLVASLQRVRDRALPRAVTAAYYRQSPPVAAALVEAPAARAAVRGALAPLAGWLAGGVPLWVLMGGLAALGALASRRRAPTCRPPHLTARQRAACAAGGEV